MLDKLVARNPEILGGAPVFAGTRVPVRMLLEYLEAGDRPDEFVAGFPAVSRNQAVALLQRAMGMLMSETNESAA